MIVKKEVVCFTYGINIVYKLSFCNPQSYSVFSFVIKNVNHVSQWFSLIKKNIPEVPILSKVTLLERNTKERIFNP